MNKQVALLLCGMAYATFAQAEPPSQITFNNNTDLALRTSISSFPGQGIAPNASKTVSYFLVNLGCYYSTNKLSCPIEFVDNSNGAKVATVYINSETATLTQPPIFHGNYGSEYEVTGWEASPIKEISINRKV